MTGPAVLDYPDFIHTFAAARNAFINDVGIVINANNVYPTFATGNLHSLGILFQDTNNHARLQILWFLDQAMTALLTQDQVDLRQNSTFDQSIPVKGSYCQITVIPFGGVSSTYNLRVYEMPTDALSQRASRENMLFFNNGVSVPATTTTTITATRVAAAEAAVMMYSSDAAAWSCQMKATDSAGSVFTLSRSDNKFPIVGNTLFLPACVVSIDLTNGDAAPRTFWAQITYKPIVP